MTRSSNTSDSRRSDKTGSSCRKYVIAGGVAIVIVAVIGIPFDIAAAAVVGLACGTLAIK